MAAVAAIELPGELTDGAVPGAAELATLPPHGLEAVHVIERCIATHHVVELDYVEGDGDQERLLERPGFIRMSSAHHVVLWAIPVGADHWVSLRLAKGDAAVRDLVARREHSKQNDGTIARIPGGSHSLANPLALRRGMVEDQRGRLRVLQRVRERDVVGNSSHARQTRGSWSDEMIPRR